MNEGQRKPERWYQFLNRNDWRSGFLRVLLIVLVIVGIGVIVAVVSAENCYIDCGSGQKPAAYNTSKEQIQTAVTFYAENHNQSLPILNVTYTNANCSDCHVVNLSALLTANGGLLREAPYCLNLSASGNDNCGGNASLGCSNHSSYIWLVNASGDVYSYCAGAGCRTNNSGYQDVWP